MKKSNKLYEKLLSMPSDELLSYIKEPVILGVTKDAFIRMTVDDKWSFLKSIYKSLKEIEHKKYLDDQSLLKLEEMKAKLLDIKKIVCPDEWNDLD